MSLAADIKSHVSDGSLYDVLQNVGSMHVIDGSHYWIVVRRNDEYAKIHIRPGYGWNDTATLSIEQAYDVNKAYRQGTIYWVPADVRAL